MSHQATYKPREALDLWEPKRTLTLEAARRHSSRIRFFRRFLIALAIILLGLLIWQFDQQKPNPISDDNPTESVKMINPRYSGRTDDGLPFYLTAGEAVRTTFNTDHVNLIEPILHFYRQANVDASTIKATSGAYDDVQKVLNLKDQVVLQTDDGNHCLTTHARIFAQLKQVEGDDPIRCDGGFGVVNGQAYDIQNNYSVFIFKDGMDAVLNQSQTADGSLIPQTGLMSFGGSGPIYVSADQATYEGLTTTLSGSVDVKQGEAQILSDHMVIYRQSPIGLGGETVSLGAVSRIEAKGHFKYTNPDNVVTGQQGTYNRDTGIITVTGNVTVTQASGNMVKTDALTYNVNTDTIRFSGNCLGPNCQSRQRFRIGNGN